MRWFFIFFTGVLIGFAPLASAQERQDTAYVVLSLKDLPKSGQKAKFRIFIKSAPKGTDSLFKFAKEFTAKYKITTYVLQQKRLLQVHAGDYSDRKYAKEKIGYWKKKVPKVKTVKAVNDSIFAFYLVEKKKSTKSSSQTGSGKQPYVVKYEPPLPPGQPPITQAPKAAGPVTDQKGSTVKNPDGSDANTAINEAYLTENEKQVFFFLNKVRMNPKQFLDKYLAHLKGSKDSYESSLCKELQNLSPLKPLKPNRKLFESAKCHAEESGKDGTTGHYRAKCTSYFMGECCQYGVEDPLHIVIELLVDQGVTSLGHRKICLDPDYTELGVAIRPHKSYRVNTVLDFK